MRRGRHSLPTRAIGAEDGFALASVMFLGAVMILLSAIIVMRGMGQSDLDVNDAEWEQALHVAEGGMDDFLAELVLVSDPDAVDTGHTASQLSDKDAIIGAAEALAVSDPSSVRSTPDGEVVVLKPSDDSIIYAVGFTPDLGTAGRKARVIEIDYDYSAKRTPNFGAKHALLSGGTIELDSASSGIYDPSGKKNASVHANGKLSKHKNFTLEGCAVSLDDLSTVGENCPDPSTIIFEQIPDVDPLVVHDLATYDLCEGGIVKAASAGTAPCAGSYVGAVSGVSAKMVQGVWEWTLSKTPPSGVYYVDGGNIDIKTAAKDGMRDITVIAATVNDDPKCLNSASTGNIYVSSGALVTSHSSASGLTLVAQGDVKFRGGATVEGLIMAHEQINFQGGTGTGGAVIAEDYCDHPKSPVTGVSSVSGGAGITYGGSISTPFEGYSDELELAIFGRDEV